MRDVVLRVHTASALSGVCHAALRLIGALRFAREFHTAFTLTRIFATPLRGLSRHFASLVGCTRLPHSRVFTPLRGLSGHFASLVLSKKSTIAAYRGTLLCSWSAHGFRIHSALRHAASRLSGHFASLVVSNKYWLPIRNLNPNFHLSQKVPISHKKFDQKFPLFQTWIKFFADFSKYSKFILLKLNFCQI